MADLTLYGLKTCDTCRKAIKALEEAGHRLTVRDVRADGVAAEYLASWLAVHGEALINMRSTTWRGLDDATRERALDPAGTVAVLAGSRLDGALSRELFARTGGLRRIDVDVPGAQLLDR
jgi:arsenate reductase-like glutaredoxin family protein